MSRWCEQVVVELELVVRGGGGLRWRCEWLELRCEVEEA